jgi:hypothetical protein
MSEGDEASSTDGSTWCIDVQLSVQDGWRVLVVLIPHAQGGSTGMNSRTASLSQTHHWSHPGAEEEGVATGAHATVADEPGHPSQFKRVNATGYDEESLSSGPLPVVSLQGALFQFLWPAQLSCMNSVYVRL